MKGSVNSIETFGLLDGPGIRTVIFLNGCKLRCLYCHNPETWIMQNLNYTAEEIANIVIKNKPYFTNGGGVTFSGGEPLLQSDFIIEICKILKKENIHIALDTAGCGNGNYDEILKYIDLVILDIKAVKEDEYKYITGRDMSSFNEFKNKIIELNKNVWIRQVIVPNINDDKKHIDLLKEYVKQFKNLEKIELLPYHTSGVSKYDRLNIPYKLKDIADMDKNKCDELYNYLKES